MDCWADSEADRPGRAVTRQMLEILAMLPPDEQSIRLCDVAADLGLKAASALSYCYKLRELGYDLAICGPLSNRTVFARRAGYEKIKQHALLYWAERNP